MYGIEDNIYTLLQNYFKRNKDIRSVILFGSRAKGLYGKASDIDLCIEYIGRNKGTLVLEIEDRVGIYGVDIVFQDMIGEELKSQILRDGVQIYSIAMEL